MTNKEYWNDDLERFKKIETEDVVVCPYCFTARQLHTDEFDSEEWEDEEECDICGHTYKVEAEVRFELWAKTAKIESKGR